MGNNPSREARATPYAVDTFQNSSNTKAPVTTTSSRAVTRQRNHVFRVTGLLASQTNDALVDFIYESLLKIEERSQLKVTASIVPSCSNNGQETVALVEFEGRVPDFLSVLVANPLEDWQVEMGDVDITFDQHFFGFTQLYTPKADKPVTADVIAIAGLDGHAYGSWRGRGNLGRMWLRHFLSQDLPYCRTMIYGYNSKLSIRGDNTILDYSRGLIDALKKIRNTEELRQRPLFFIAHSFGGIILAHCLIKAVQTNEDDHPTIAMLHKATYGMLLFGIPHKGLLVNDIEKMLASQDNHPRSALLQQIRAKSDLLENQLADFKNLLRDRKIVSFYETRPTRQLQFNSDSQCWERTGDFITNVDSDSALLQLPDFMEEKIPLDSDHSMMVKFGNRNDTGYTSALLWLRQFEQKASNVVKARFSPVQRTSTAKYLVPYTSNPDFVGRSEILKILKERLGHTQQANSTSQARASLYGLGGTGKTQIALEYAFQLQKTHPTVSVFWIHASSAARFRQAFASIAQEYDIPGYEEPKVDMLQLVKSWLEKKDHGEWLMVIDNADDMQILFGQPAGTATSPGKAKDEKNLARYLPECAHGSILITTRDKKVGVRMTKGQQPIEVLRMNEEESEQLLRAKLKDISTTVTELSTLSSQLEHLPLALAQAAAFIQETSITVHKYLQLLSHSDKGIVYLLSREFETVGRDTEAPQAVAQTWVLSFQQIEQQHVLASELLSFMSMLDRQDIPAQFISHYAEQAGNGVPQGEIELTEALGILKAFSFVTEETSGSFDMHRLVQLVTRKWLTSQGTIGRFGTEALMTVSEMYPFGKYETRTKCAAYLSHANAVLQLDELKSRDENEAKASLLHCVAGYFNFEGKWHDAEISNIKAREIRRDLLGYDHLDTLSSMANLASTYRNQGRWKEAEDLEVQVMETRKMKLGADHPDTLTSMANLASTFWNQGRWKEAEDLEIQVMETRKMKIGADHPDTLSSMADLASTFWNQGRWKEAEDLEVQVMEISKSKLGVDHPDTLTSMANLASTFWNQGRWKEAEDLEVQVMETRKMKLGADHPDTLTSISNLASTYRNQGRWKEAEDLEVQVMETRKMKLGADHPDTLTSMSNLASTFWDQGRWKEAEDLEVQVMETRKMKLGADHPDTLTSMADLASTFSNQGRWKEAENLEVQVMETRKMKLGADHPDTLTSISNLASTFSNQGRWKEAEDLEVQVIEISKVKLSADHPDTLISMGNLALTYRNQGRWKEAEDLEVQVMEISKTKLGADHPDTLTSIGNLASIYRYQGRWKEAEDLEVQVMETCKTKLGVDHPDTLSSIGSLALTYNKQGRWKEAEDLEVQVIETRKIKLGADHQDTVTSMANLASIYRNQGRWKKAEDLEVQVIEARKTKLGADHPHTLTSISNLASIFLSQGRWKKAEDLYLQVMETYKTKLGVDHPDTISSIANLASTFLGQGRWKKAEDLYLQVIETCKTKLGADHPHTLTRMANLASTFLGQGRWKKAEDLYLQVIETCKTKLGADHPDTLTSMANLASTYRNQGRLKEAEDLFVEVVEISKTKLGADHPDTLSRINNLAITWKRQGRHNDALVLMESCAQTRRQVLGPRHPQTILSQSMVENWGI